MLTSLDPLRLYVWPNGLVRMASRPYQLETDSIDDLCVHCDGVNLNQPNVAAFTAAVGDQLGHRNEGLRCDVRVVHCCCRVCYCTAAASAAAAVHCCC